MNIRSGMRAADGAAEDVRITEQGVELAVIGDGRPEGICGSGILAVTKELLRTRTVEKTGAFIKKEKLSENDYRYPLIRMNGAKREMEELALKMEYMELAETENYERIFMESMVFPEF